MLVQEVLAVLKEDVADVTLGSFLNTKCDIAVPYSHVNLFGQHLDIWVSSLV